MSYSCEVVCVSLEMSVWKESSRRVSISLFDIFKMELSLWNER
jgi:hypothetical protein